MRFRRRLDPPAVPTPPPDDVARYRARVDAANEWTAALPLFGIDTTCAKCDSSNVDQTYCPANFLWWPMTDARFNPHAEHMVRTCRSCGYRWPERPLEWTPAVIPPDVENDATPGKPITP